MGTCAVGVKSKVAARNTTPRCGKIFSYWRRTRCISYWRMSRSAPSGAHTHPPQAQQPNVKGRLTNEWLCSPLSPGRSGRGGCGSDGSGRVTSRIMMGIMRLRHALARIIVLDAPEEVCPSYIDLGLLRSLAFPKINLRDQWLLLLLLLACSTT